MSDFLATATTVLAARPGMGGQGVDILDCEWEIDRHGGFGGATLEVVPPWGVSRFDPALLAALASRDVNGHLLWEGRCEEPDLVFPGAQRLTIEAAGYGGYLTDDEAFQRCYVDNDLASWQTDQATKYADRFSVGIEDDDKLVLRVACSGGDPGQVLHDGMNCRAYWQLFGGAQTTQQASGLRFHYEADAFDVSLRCRLYGRDKLSGGSVDRLLWTSPATFDPSGDVELDAGDIGSDVRVLVFRLEQVGETITEYTDLALGDTESWSLAFGIAFSGVEVYASDLGLNVTPERVVRDAVLEFCSDDAVDFPDSSGYALTHCDFSDPTTIAQVIEDVDAMLDWDWGFTDGGVFFYRKPWTAATVPDGELVVTSFSDPCLSDWSVRRDFAGCYNRVVGHFTLPSGRIQRVEAHDSEGPLGGTWKTKHVDLTDVCSREADAQDLIEAELAHTLWPSPTGMLTLRGDAHLAVGMDVPAIYVRPGMMVRNLDLAADATGRPSDRGRMLVSHVTGRQVAREVTLEVGTRSSRLTRMLARRDHEARRIRRRKKRR